MSDLKATHLQASERLKNLSQQIFIYSQRYESIRDERAIFAFMYFEMTECLVEDLEINRRFDDPTWVVDLSEAFGALFIKAMDNIDAWLKTDQTDFKTIYATVSKPWADVYLAIRNGQSYVLEDMLFSMMAHISYHLPLALLEVEFDVSHIGDYHRINDVLASSIDKIQDSVAQRYNRHLFFLDQLVGDDDEFLTNYSIRVARSTAWYNANRLSTPTHQQEAYESIVRSTAAFIRSIRRPKSSWRRFLIMVLRRIIPARRKWPKSSSSSVTSENGKDSSSGDQNPPTFQIKNEDLQEAKDSDVTDHSSPQDQPDQQAAVEQAAAEQKEGIDRQDLLALTFLALLTIGIIFFQSLYSLIHGINPLDVYRGLQVPNEFGFIGGAATPYAIGQEILFWTITGVSIRMAYITAKETKLKQFRFLKSLILWISTSLLAWGIGIGLIFSLSLISITIGDNTIDPVSSIETVIAFSFIIGFYYEEALGLLGKIREELSLQSRNGNKSDS